MPVHEYACGECGRRFERLHFAGDEDPAPACPACGAPETRRIARAEPLFSGGLVGTGDHRTKFA